MKNSQYPRIKKSSCSVVLFTSENCGYLLDHVRGEQFHPTYEIHSFRSDWIESFFDDYPEWLNNKYGYLNDKKQREYILSIAKNHRMKTNVFSHESKTQFIFLKNFEEQHMQILGHSARVIGTDFFDIDFLKLIEVPESTSSMDKVNAEVEEQLIEALKCDEELLPEFTGSDTDNKTIPFDELVSDCLNDWNEGLAQKKEWPKVGGRVLYGPLNLIFKVVAIDDGLAWIKNDVGISTIAKITELKKLKSPEVELCEALAEKGVQDVVILANQIINGEFDCLKYIPEEERKS